MHGWDFKTLPGRGLPASDFLKEVIRNVKLRLPCQILSQHQSGPAAQTVSCWGRSLGHSIGHLTTWMATWVSQALGMNMILAGSAGPFCRVRCEAVGLDAPWGRVADCTWLSGGSRHLECTGFPHWIAGYLAGHFLTQDCLLSPCGLVW